MYLLFLSLSLVCSCSPVLPQPIILTLTLTVIPYCLPHISPASNTDLDVHKDKGGYYVAFTGTVRASGRARVNVKTAVSLPRLKLIKKEIEKIEKGGWSDGA